MIKVLVSDALSEEGLKIFKESKMKLDAIKRAIDFDLNKKLSMTKILLNH